jgi:hypothetical protein
MMALPSQFDEALRIPRSIGSLYLTEGSGEPAGPERVAQKGVAELKTHHKVAAARSQPCREGAEDGEAAQPASLERGGRLC